MSAQAPPAAKRARRAVTLIEAVLFISIALAVIVGGLVFYRQATIARQTQETVRLVQAIVAEARVLWRQSGKFPLDSSDPQCAWTGAACSGRAPVERLGRGKRNHPLTLGGKDINQQQGSLWQSAGHADRGRI
jgi:hypothetical protein